MDFIFDPSLVLYLPLYKLDGTSLLSKDAYGHLCTVTGAVWRPTGRYFDGSDDFIDVGMDVNTLGVSTEGTFIIWVNPSGTSDTRAVVNDYRTTPVINGMSLRVNDTNTLTFYARDADVASFSVATTDTITADAWHCIIGSFHLPKAYIDIDGNISKEGDCTGGIGASGSNCCVGQYKWGASQRLGGRVGEVLIFNRFLVLSERQSIYLATKWRYR